VVPHILDALGGQRVRANVGILAYPGEEFFALKDLEELE
jgi:hypothetical protein